MRAGTDNRMRCIHALNSCYDVRSMHLHRRSHFDGRSASVLSVPFAFSLGVCKPTGVLHTCADEHRTVVDGATIADTLDGLADERVRLLVADERMLRQRDQRHDGRFVAVELVPQHVTPMLDRRAAISVCAPCPRLTV